MTCGPSNSANIVDGTTAYLQATWSLTTDTAKATPAVYWQGSWGEALVCNPQAKGFSADFADSTLCGYVGDEAECCNPADLTNSAQCVCFLKSLTSGSVHVLIGTGADMVVDW